MACPHSTSSWFNWKWQRGLREGKQSAQRRAVLKTQKSELCIPQRGCQLQSGHCWRDKRTKEGTTCCPRFSLKSHIETPTRNSTEDHPGHSLGNSSCHQWDQGSPSEGNYTFLLRSTKGFICFIFQIISCQVPAAVESPIKPCLNFLTGLFISFYWLGKAKNPGWYQSYWVKEIIKLPLGQYFKWTKLTQPFSPVIVWCAAQMCPFRKRELTVSAAGDVDLWEQIRCLIKIYQVHKGSFMMGGRFFTLFQIHYQ